MLDVDRERADPVDQLSLVLGRNYVISIQEEAGDPFEPVRIASVTRRAGSAAPAPTTWLTPSSTSWSTRYFRLPTGIGERIETLDELVTTRSAAT